MTFLSEEHLKMYLNNLLLIGSGSHGTCYLNQTSHIVIKIFKSFDDKIFEQDNNECIYTEEEVLRFSNIPNDTFIWPTGIIKVKDMVVGSITPFVRAKNLYKINPLNVDLDRLCEAIIEVRKDIKTISSHNIFTYDMMYNILFNGKFYIIDHDDYSYNGDADLEKQNNNNLDYEIYYFLVDSFFDKVVSSNNILNSLYKDKEEDILIFIKQFRKYLGELTGEKITYLNQARKYVKRQKNKTYVYTRM